MFDVDVVWTTFEIWHLIVHVFHFNHSEICRPIKEFTANLGSFVPKIVCLL